VAATGPADHDAITQALARCDMQGFERRGIDTLSGGEWQRVRLARALAASPRLLLLDEPTAALDIGHEMQLFELLRGLSREGLGVLVITHDLNLAARYADRMVLLHRGRAAGSGTPTEVLREAVVSDVFGWPVTVTRSVDNAPQVLPLRRPIGNDPSQPPE
jgi:iron complex transport system ATP-binding protein